MHGLWLEGCVDRVNSRQLASAEHRARRLLQIQRAVRKNPRNPEFDGLESFMMHMPSSAGVAHAPKFDKYIAEEQKTQAQILKQQRMQKEEVDADADRRQKKDKNNGKKGEKDD